MTQTAHHHLFNRLALSAALIGALTLSLSATLPAMAESGTTATPASVTPHEGHGGKGGGHERMAKELNLTQDQKSKIEAIRQNFKASHSAELQEMKLHHQEMMQARQSGKPITITKEQRQANRAKFQSFREAQKQKQAQIEAILTPDQRTKMQTMRAQMRQHHGNRQGGGKHHGGGLSKQTDKTGDNAMPADQ